MARPVKYGIDYFPADVDMFQDRKIKRLLRAVSGKGFTVYIYLLTQIYRDNGYFIQWDKDFAFDVADDLNFSENVVEEAVSVCCAHGLFNKDLFTDMGVLTSESIQQRWQKIVKDANRSDTRIEARFKILDGEPVFLRRETELSTEETPEKFRVSTQSKVKESKGKETKEKSARESGYNPGIIDPPESAKKVIEIGAMRGIPPEACEMYFEMRSTDKFLRHSEKSGWKPIPNWHADLAHCYKKGWLESRNYKKQRNGKPDINKIERQIANWQDSQEV